MIYRAGGIGLALAALISITTAPSVSAQQPPTGQAEAVPELTAFELGAVLRHGPWPIPPRPDPGNELSGNALAQRLGEHLFSNSALSADDSLSCASCHQAENGFSDNRARAVGRQPHNRNSQSLWNADQHRWLGWDGGADSLWAAALRPLLSPVEMASQLNIVADAVRLDPFFVANRQALETVYLPRTLQASDESLAVFGAKAIASYVGTLRSERTSFDELFDKLLATGVRDRRQPQAPADPADGRATWQRQFKSFGYPLQAWRGLKIFVGKGRCHVCHYGPNFSNGEFHDIGRPFIVAPGQVDPGRYRGIQRVRADQYNLGGPFSNWLVNNGPAPHTLLKLVQVNWGQWRTPSLRNLKQTAPYMHDGSLATLRAVVNWYADIDVTRLHSNGETILQPLDLTESERDDLIAFLNSLSP